jgi:hypothetical protein
MLWSAMSVDAQAVTGSGRQARRHNDHRKQAVPTDRNIRPETNEPNAS